MFVTLVIPGPKNPKQRLDVFLQLLIYELKSLWDVGVETWDVSLKQNFIMRALLLWTVSDFPAYSLLSGWTTAGKKLVRIAWMIQMRSNYREVGKLRGLIIIGNFCRIIIPIEGTGIGS